MLVPDLGRASARDFHSGDKYGNHCSHLVQAKQKFGGNMKRMRAEAVNSILWKMLRNVQVLGYLIPLEDTSKETQSKGMLPILPAWRQSRGAPGLCIDKEQPFCSSSQGMRCAQALPVFLRAAASSFRAVGQEFGFESFFCILTGDAHQQIQLRLQKYDFQSDPSDEHKLYLPSPNCLKPDLLTQKIHLKYLAYFE